MPLRKDRAAELQTHFANKIPSVKAFKIPYKEGHNTAATGTNGKSDLAPKEGKP
jgi:hypothetical protein